MSVVTLSQILGGSFSYREKLKSAEWSAFRHSVYDKRGKSCEICKRSDVALNIHHWFYDNEREPWEYGLDEVSLLCEPCHKQMHVQLQNFRKYVFSKMNPNVFRIINGALTVGLEHNDPLKLAYAIAEMASSPRSVELFCKAWHERKP